MTRHYPVSRRAGLQLLVALSFLVSCSPAPVSHALPAPHTGIRVGPSNGALVVVGGGQLGEDIIDRFIELAGGPSRARIVIIPTAGGDANYGQDWGGARPFRVAGAKNITVIHTTDRETANREDFVAPIRSATGVWFPGGRQWRLADAYLHTRALEELQNLLARGGVIGGTSAGASVLASYMVRGARATNTVMMAPGYENGFGFLRNSAVDQHLSQRNRQNDMLQVIERHPDLLGIGLDENTAIVVRGDTADVIGKGRVAVYNTDPDNRATYFWLSAGDRFDLNRRAVLNASAR